MNTPHPSRLVAGSQNSRILAKLMARPGKWVPAYTLLQVSGSMAVHTRISELRTEHGHNIQQRNLRNGRIIHSHYRIIPPKTPKKS